MYVNDKQNLILQWQRWSYKQDTGTYLTCHCPQCLRTPKELQVVTCYLTLSIQLFFQYTSPLLVLSCYPDESLILFLSLTRSLTHSLALSALLYVALIAAIDRMERRGCSKSVRLVVAMTMPCPDCAPLCTNFQPSRNNHAIGALNQYFYSQLIRQNGTLLYSNLAIVDSLSIIEPNKKYAVCINHFLCRHGDRQQFRIESTPPGEALAATIAAALCYHQ